MELTEREWDVERELELRGSDADPGPTGNASPSIHPKQVVELAASGVLKHAHVARADDGDWRVFLPCERGVFVLSKVTCTAHRTFRSLEPAIMRARDLGFSKVSVRFE